MLLVLRINYNYRRTLLTTETKALRFGNRNKYFLKIFDDGNNRNGSKMVGNGNINQNGNLIALETEM